MELFTKLDAMLLLCVLLICLSASSVVHAKPSLINKNEDLLCGYQSCPAIDPEKINVHLIPHSHDDLGWLKTVNQYYIEDVQYILTSVVDALLADPNRRFIQVETAFLHHWWTFQSDIMKNNVKKLINEGRLEIINGGWGMNDEAVTHYQSIIDQFTIGHRWLVDNFGTCGLTKTGWQIDPFGHSREQASIYSQMGFDSFFFMRYDTRDKAKRRSERTMDLLWRGSDNLETDTNIFTSTFSTDTYAWPTNFCYDFSCNDPDIVDNEESTEFNLQSIIYNFNELVKERSQYYPTNNLFITMGDDVHYKGAHKNFINIDRLIRGFKKYNPTINGKEINIFYSSPSCYAKAVNDLVIKENYTLDYKTDDFLPLVTDNNCWTGFYSSKPTSKRYERTSNQILQAAKQITAFAGFPRDSLFKLASAVATMQHHDAITGTENTDVEKDYHKLLHAGITDSIIQISKAFSNLSNSDVDIDLHYCSLANVSICAESKTDQFSVLLYNPIGRSVSNYVQIPVDSGIWVVTDPEDKTVNSFLYSPIRNFSFVAENLGTQTNEKVLMFKAENLPPLGYKIYQIVKSTKQESSGINNKPEFMPEDMNDDTKVGYEKNYVLLDKESGFVKTMSINGYEVNVTPKVMFYYSDWGSGAYMFSPNATTRDPVPFTDKVNNQITSSDVSIEIRQEMKDWGILNIRIYPDTHYIEIDWLAGEIDVRDDQGKDVIIKYTTDLKTESIFYTDSNSRELIRRKRNYRPTFTYTNEAPEAGNYYPITSRVVLRDESAGTEFAIITDRAEGGSSLADGEVELMIHRAQLRYEFGDRNYEIEYGRGILARGSHYITFGPIKGENGVKSAAYIQRDIAIKKHVSPVTFFPRQTVAKKSLSFLNKELPENVHLLTLEKWNDVDNSYLIRLEHFLEKNDDSDLSPEVTVDLENLFTTFKIVSLQERSLNGVLALEDVKRLDWPQIKKSDSNVLNMTQRLKRDASDLKITLSPMQIRTFIATTKTVDEL